MDIGTNKIDDWDSPSPSLIPTIINLTDKDSKLICVPAGYANCLKAKMMMRLSSLLRRSLAGGIWRLLRYDSSLWIDWSEF